MDFGHANLSAKHGEGWEAKSVESLRSRLPSWGFNSYGCWSDRKVAVGAGLPYTVFVQIHNGWGDSKDPVRDDEQALRERLRQKLEPFSDSFEDPWCIGFF